MTPSATAPNPPSDQTLTKPLDQTVTEEIAVKADESGIIWPPSDLYSDEPPLETTLHLRQMMLLLNCLDWLWKDREDYFAGGNLTIYYSPRQRKDEDFRGPDFFVVLNTQPHPRRSWMVWEEEGKYPNVIVELLSDSTAEVDRTLKKTLYAETFRTPEYFWFDPDSQEFQGFALVRGHYQPIEPSANGQMWSEQLQLHLGLYNQTLRFFDAEGALVATSAEDALVAEQVALVAEQAALVAEQTLHAERQRSERLADKLRELGIDPNDL
ncbi:MAG: hypothetical protein DCF15_08530 [Phormidesmis priestleyi]|uniref:Putative restriction endonuclease domain-containing protein n=1 Tax=Phormidesmis priestleyi TaxID=268141 RepID=A0A2W4XHN7_9CYAN|nr:MAG: hypothetical protein DCF15_08530 [Phormidesmis priestleyi]